MLTKFSINERATVRPERGPIMDPTHEYVLYESRRQFLGRGVNAVGGAALAPLLGGEGLMPGALAGGLDRSITTGKRHFPPKAKHVIYLHMVGGPSRMDMNDYKPQMNDGFAKDRPDPFRW